MSNIEKIITTGEAAEILGISQITVRSMIRRKVILNIEKRGRDWFLDETEVRELAAKPRPVGRRWPAKEDEKDGTTD